MRKEFCELNINRKRKRNLQAEGDNLRARWRWPEENEMLTVSFNCRKLHFTGVIVAKTVSWADQRNYVSPFSDLLCVTDANGPTAMCEERFLREFWLTRGRISSDEIFSFVSRVGQRANRKTDVWQISRLTLSLQQSGRDITGNSSRYISLL